MSPPGRRSAWPIAADLGSSAPVKRPPTGIPASANAAWSDAPPSDSSSTGSRRAAKYARNAFSIRTEP